MRRKNIAGKKPAKEKKMKKNKTIREVIIQCIINFGGDVKIQKKDIKVLEDKVLQENPENPTHYAWVITRNWAVNAKRHKEAQKRFELKKLKQMLEEEKVRERKECYDKAKSEFWSTAERAIDNCSAQKSIFWMEAIWQQVFEKQTTEETIASFLPDIISRDMLYQYRRRGRVLLSKFGSDEMKKILSENKKINFS